ncbi:hypothetical protein ACWEP4_42570 [Streptomyces sp. NPDC004227]
MAGRVIVHPLGEVGSRRVTVDGIAIGTAYSIQDLVVFLEHAGLEGWDELDVAGSDLIEWRGGGPDDWRR